MIAALLATALAGRYDLSYEYSGTFGDIGQGQPLGLDGAHAFGLHAAIPALQPARSPDRKSVV